MKKSITLIIVLVLILFCHADSIIASDTMSVEEFTKSLLPEKQRSLGGVRPVAEKPSVAMRLQFELNSAKLTPDAVMTLQNLGKALQKEKLRAYKYGLEGHTCDLGSDQFNLTLSRKRAKAVQDYLTNYFGLSAGQFEVTGYGERNPAVNNTDESARQKNRRVIIINTLKPYTPGKAGNSRIDVEVKCIRNNNITILENGETLTNNDNYAVEFKPKSAMYVYVYQVDVSGTMTRIFPNPNYSQEQNPVQPGMFYRVPGQGNWFYLDNNTGKEQVIVLANKSSLSQPDRICMNEIKGSSPGGSSDIMLASASGTKQRGLMGIREEQPQTPPSTAEVRPPHDDTGSLFVWKRYFNHQ